MSLILGLVNLDSVGHDLSVLANLALSVLHNLDLDTKDTLSELNVSGGHIDELELGLTSRDEITLLVLLGLCSLTSDLTRDDDLAALCTTAAHDGCEDVVSSKTDGVPPRSVYLRFSAWAEAQRFLS